MLIEFLFFMLVYPASGRMRSSFRRGDFGPEALNPEPQTPALKGLGFRV